MRPRARETPRPTTSTSAASPSRAIRSRTRRRSPCSSARVGLDPDYAPAWAALVTPVLLRRLLRRRLARRRSSARASAAQKALALDPNLTEATVRLVVLATEGGKLEEAYAKAGDLVRRRPQDGHAHFSLAYVLRYAGLMEESARECETARALDPRNRLFRSCGFLFMQSGDYARARDFARLDAGSAWSKNVEADILLREGKRDVALSAVRMDSNLPAGGYAVLLAAPGAERDRPGRRRGGEGHGRPRSGEQVLHRGPPGARRLPATGLCGCSGRPSRTTISSTRRWIGTRCSNRSAATREFAAIRAESIRRQKEFLARRAPSP